MQPSVNIFWFRRDLRLQDNTGLFHALNAGLPVQTVFIFDEHILCKLENKHDPRVSFIHDALSVLQKSLCCVGATLDVRYGKPEEVFVQLASEYKIQAVFANHDYEPYARERDESIAKLLLEKGITFRTFKDQVLFEKAEIVKNDGQPYSVYTPYSKKWKACLTPQQTTPFLSSDLLHQMHKQPVKELLSLQNIGFKKSYYQSNDTLDENIIRHYHMNRDLPSVKGTSRLGICLRFGTISIRQVAAKALEHNITFLGELIWREFFMQMLWHHPRLVHQPFRKQYRQIKWRNNEDEFKRWCNGETGFPIVDAGMRELNETGFMHNRVRMIAASFLVKHLLIDWQWGEAYFAQKLLDFELSSNNGNWQWVAGCGCDAAPYFRVFNPYTQAKKFDPQFEYIKKWVPDWNQSSYPPPMVDHDVARHRCLKIYKESLA